MCYGDDISDFGAKTAKRRFACRMHALSITPHKRSAVWGMVISTSICVPAARALEPSLR